MPTCRLGRRASIKPLNQSGSRNQSPAPCAVIYAVPNQYGSLPWQQWEENMFTNPLKSGLVALSAIGLAAFNLAAVSTDAGAQTKVRWKMQSAFGSQLPHLGPSGLRFSKDIERMSDGKFEVKFYEPGALIPPLECFDAVSKGSIESCWTTPGYHTGKYPALAFFTTVPFGPSFGEFMAWKWFGGGNKLRDEIYAKHDLFAVDCFCIGPETSGWFRNEIKSLDELKGLKMRFFGLGAQVMQKDRKSVV